MATVKKTLGNQLITDFTVLYLKAEKLSLS